MKKLTKLIFIIIIVLIILVFYVFLSMDILREVLNINTSKSSVIMFFKHLGSFDLTVYLIWNSVYSFTIDLLGVLPYVLINLISFAFMFYIIKEKVRTKIGLTILCFITFFSVIGLYKLYSSVKDHKSRKETTKSLAEKLRNPIGLENAYAGFASLTGSEIFCKKISNLAINKYPFNPDGFEVKKVKSDCYKNLASIKKNKELCKMVQPVSTDMLDGNSFNEAHCLKTINSSASMGLGPREFWEIVTLMGYNEDNILEALQPIKKKKRSSAHYYLERYKKNGHLTDLMILFKPDQIQGDFIKRAKKLPDYNK